MHQNVSEFRLKRITKQADLQWEKYRNVGETKRNNSVYVSISFISKDFFFFKRKTIKTKKEDKNKTCCVI
jgi:hypothetical protein